MSSRNIDDDLNELDDISDKHDIDATDTPDNKTINEEGSDESESTEEDKIEITNAESDKPQSDSKFFAIRTTGGQEQVVVNLAKNKITSKNIAVRSIILLDSFKGYIIIEAPDSNIAYEALAGIRHVKGQIRGELPYKDIEGFLIKRPVASELNIEDTVEVIAGPFKSMKAKITRVDYEKQEATVLLLDSPYQIPVTVDANYLKKIH
ncbi:MAG: transcription elongation factor Spt5 [Nitrososphaeraceae archaeon]